MRRPTGIVLAALLLGGLDPGVSAAATKWSMTWMVWLQDHLLSWAFLV